MWLRGGLGFCLTGEAVHCIAKVGPNDWWLQKTCSRLHRVTRVPRVTTSYKWFYCRNAYRGLRSGHRAALSYTFCKVVTLGCPN